MVEINPMDEPEALNVQLRFRYLEWAAIVLTACAQFVWATAIVRPDWLSGISFALLAIIFVLAGLTPRTIQGQFHQLLAQVALIVIGSAIGAHHFYYILLYVLAVKAAILLPRTQLLVLIAVMVAGHIASGQFFQFALHNIHTIIRPMPPYYRSFIIEGEQYLYFVILLIAVTFLGRTLINERKSKSAEKALANEVEQLAVNLERARIARDIHDGLGHSLMSSKIQLERALMILEHYKPEEAPAQELHKDLPELLANCKDSVSSSLAEVRQALKSEGEREISLSQSITELIEQIKQQSELEITAHLQDLEDMNLAPGAQHQIFSIIQECLNNIRKHAQAEQVDIRFSHKGRLACVSVCDNGKGFAVDSKHSGFGLKGLHERAEIIGGELKIESSPKGTAISVSFPLVAGKNLD